MTLTEAAFQSDCGQEVTDRIITSIAAQLQTDVLDLPPLHHTIDTDALATVIQSESFSGIEFTYHGHDVVIDSDGRVNVTVTGAANR